MVRSDKSVGSNQANCTDSNPKDMSLTQHATDNQVVSFTVANSIVSDVVSRSDAVSVNAGTRDHMNWVSGSSVRVASLEAPSTESKQTATAESTQVNQSLVKCLIEDDVVVSNVPVLNRPQESELKVQGTEFGRVQADANRVDFHSSPRVGFDHFQPPTYSTPVDNENSGVRSISAKQQTTSMSEPRGVRFERCPESIHSEMQYEQGVFSRSNYQGLHRELHSAMNTRTDGRSKVSIPEVICSTRPSFGRESHPLFEPDASAVYDGLGNGCLHVGRPGFRSVADRDGHCRNVDEVDHDGVANSVGRDRMPYSAAQSSGHVENAPNVDGGVRYSKGSGNSVAYDRCVEEAGPVRVVPSFDHSTAARCVYSTGRVTDMVHDTAKLSHRVQDSVGHSSYRGIPGFHGGNDVQNLPGVNGSYANLGNRQNDPTDDYCSLGSQVPVKQFEIERHRVGCNQNMSVSEVPMHKSILAPRDYGHSTELPREKGFKSQHVLPQHDSYSVSKVTARKAMSPETYDGEGDWEEYLLHFSDVAEWNGWTEYEKATQLGLHLRGMARSIKTDLPHHVAVDFGLLVQTLHKYFSSEGREATFQAEFRLRKRERNEKLSHFAHELTRLCKKAFPRMDRSSREQFVLERFKLGLDPGLRRHIQFQHAESIEKAIYAGLEFEAMEEDVDRDRIRKPLAAIHTTVADAPKSEDNVSGGPNDLMLKMMEQNMAASQKMLESVTKMVENMQKTQRQQRDLSQVVCYNCNQKGHFRNRCPQLYTNFDTRQQAAVSVDQAAVSVDNSGNA